MIEEVVYIEQNFGLNARLSALIALIANMLKSNIFLVKNQKEYDAKSIMALIMIEGVKGDRLLVRANGLDEDVAVKSIVSIFQITNIEQIEEDFVRINRLNQLMEKPHLTQDELIEIEYEQKELKRRGGKLTNKLDSDFVDTVENASGKFGYEQTNPIPVDNAIGEQLYIEHLQCKCGVPFLYQRAGVTGTGPDGHFLDLYVLICKNFKHRTELYFDMYHGKQSELIPKGIEKGTCRGCSIMEHLQSNPNDREKLERFIQNE